MAENKYIFRKATNKDLDNFFVLFAKLTKERFPEYSKRTKDYWIKKEFNLQSIISQFKARQISIHLAVYCGEIIGYLMARPISGGVCLGVWLAVDEAHERRGVATGLLKLWENDTKKQGIHKLHLMSDKRNLNFYRNKGFTLLGMIPKNHYGVDDYLFYKSIQKPLAKNYLK